MEIIPIHYKLSKPVEKYKEIKKEVEALKKFIDKPNLQGYFNKAFAIAHCQVSETPYAFFVVADDVIVDKNLNHRHKVMINPEIIDIPQKAMVMEEKTRKLGLVDNLCEFNEQCLSFPYRKDKKVNRYWSIRVRYQVPGLFGLKTIEEWKEGVISQIFQHEIDHLNAKNIYFDNEHLVKWWELIGTPKSKGGVSIGT